MLFVNTHCYTVLCFISCMASVTMNVFQHCIYKYLYETGRILQAAKVKCYQTHIKCASYNVQPQEKVTNFKLD